VSDRSRQQHREYDPHLGLGNRREDSTYRPKFTHEDLDRIVDELLQRISENGSDIGIIDLGEGTLVTGYSKPYYPLRDATLSVVYWSLVSPGATDCEAEVNLNGAAAGTIVMPAGETFASLNLSLDFNPTDRWQMNVTASDSAATGPTFFGRFD
jgi:hypothetical protein